MWGPPTTKNASMFDLNAAQHPEGTFVRNLQRQHTVTAGSEEEQLAGLARDRAC